MLYLSLTSKETYVPTTEHKSDIFKCFGVRASDQIDDADKNSSTHICNSCYGCLLKFRSDGTIHPDQVDSQGQTGFRGHQQIGGKRKAIRNPESVSKLKLNYTNNYYYDMTTELNEILV